MEKTHLVLLTTEKRQGIKQEKTRTTVEESGVGSVASWRMGEKKMLYTTTCQRPV